MSLSTTQYGYIVDPMVPFTDDKGKTIKNGFIRVFMAGTSTPVLTYRNYDGATNQEKIELDNSGRVKHNVIGSKGSLYKVVVYNILHSQENPLLTVDKIAVLGASINASGATIVTGLDSVTVPEENFLKATVEGTGVELALDPMEVTSEVSTTADAVTAGPDYVAPLLDKTGTGDGKKISLANLFKFALDWISRLATTVTSFASGDFIAVSNTTIGARKMSKDTLLELTAQNSKDSLGLLPISKTQIFGGYKPAGITSLDDFNDNNVIEVLKTSYTTITNFPSEYDGYGILIVEKTNYSNSDYRVYQKLIHYNSRTMYSRRFDSSNNAWTAWTSNAIEGKFLKTIEKALWANYAGNMASLDDAPANTSLVIAASSATSTTNFPSDFIDNASGTEGVLFTFETLIPTNDATIKKQLLIRLSDGRSWSRSKVNSWTSWSNGSLSAASDFAAYATYSFNMSSLNDAEINKIYLVNPTSSTATTNFPSDYGEGMGVLYTQKSMYSSSYYLKVQMLVKLVTGEIWHRQYVSATSTWGSWNKASRNDGTLTASDWFGVYTDKATNLASLNDAVTNKTYLIRKTGNTTTANFPIDFGEGDGILSTYQGKYTSSYSLKYQILAKLPDGKIWYRQYVSATSTWGAWRSSEGGVITIGQGKMFETLREGFDFAFTQYNAKVVVYPGDYDLVEEFADVLPTISAHAGCPVGRGMHAVFMAGSYVSAIVEKGEYTDAQFNAIKLYFHPFAFTPDSNDLNDDFVVEGLNISAKNTRYSFHDDFGGSQEPCLHKFIDCVMSYENSATTSSNNFINAIGGGLGRHTTIVVDGGYYESIVNVGSQSIMDGDVDYSQQPIAYHNTTALDADSESKIILKNVFFADKGYFHAAAIGGSNVTSKIYIDGCRFGLPPLLRKGSTNPAESPYFNVELKAYWNNDVAQKGHWVLGSDDRTATWVAED